MNGMDGCRIDSKKPGKQTSAAENTDCRRSEDCKMLGFLRDTYLGKEAEARLIEMGRTKSKETSA